MAKYKERKEEKKKRILEGAEMGQVVEVVILNGEYPGVKNDITSFPILNSTCVQSDKVLWL